MQAIGHLDLPCKFAANGCKHVSERAVMREHTHTCSFGPKIECPYWNCETTVPLVYGYLALEKLSHHLKNVHGHTDENQMPSENPLIGRCYTKRHEDITWKPWIISFKGHNFFLLACTENNVWMFWAVILGTEEDANKYEVIMSIKGNDGDNLDEFRGKVFSTDEDKKNVIWNPEGVLMLENDAAENFGSETADGLQIKLDYQIIRKSEFESEYETVSESESVLEESADFIDIFSSDSEEDFFQ